jgi:plasmid rolling circle replication initiator protein Rep
MGQFNTLGEIGTNKSGQNSILVTGKGSDLSNNKTLKGKAKRKTITQSLMRNLIDIAKEKEDVLALGSYWNTYYCQNRIIEADGRSYGRYCKNRFCTLCCSIRKAELVNKYLPIIQTWEKAYFVTLTVKAVKEDQLRRAIRKMLKGFTEIKDKHRKRWQRRNGRRLKGVRSLECNFNPKTKTYNPHLHLIVDSKETAEILINDWLKKWKAGGTNKYAQHMEQIYNAESGLIEIIKYGSKIFTEPDLDKKSESGMPSQIYLAALETIFSAMKGVRIFERFGFNNGQETDEIENNLLSKTKLVTDYKEFEFDPAKSDWVNTCNDEVLSGYDIPIKLSALLTNGIDKTSR